MTLLDKTLNETLASIPVSLSEFGEVFPDDNENLNTPLREILSDSRINAVSLLSEIEKHVDQVVANYDISSHLNKEIIDHLLSRYHKTHREQLPEIIELAQRVERVHGDHPLCPRALSSELENVQQELDAHMLKEEEILFPMILQNMGAMCGSPITVMKMEHDHHQASIQKIKDLTNDLTLPADACGSWRRLYTGIESFLQDLEDHIYIENNVLFKKVTP